MVWTTPTNFTPIGGYEESSDKYTEAQKKALAAQLSEEILDKLRELYEKGDVVAAQKILLDWLGKNMP